jgi:ABC-type uncharacterized transport system auxiliary subunit
MRNVFAGVLLSLVLCGCGIFSKEPYRRVNYYDFGCKADKQYGLSINVSGVAVDRPYSDKMVFRISENRLEIDEYNRWAGSLSELVKKYFTLSFENKDPAKPSEYFMKVEVMQLEADLNKSFVTMVMQITIISAQKDKVVLQKVYKEEIPLIKVTGENYAKGVETALGKITGELVKDLIR